MLAPGIYSFGDIAITLALTGYALEPITNLEGMSELSAEFYFAGGSGGTSLKAWLESSLSQGSRWHDIACFEAANANKTRMVSLRRSADSGLWTPTNGTLADDSVASSIVLGDRLRMLLTTVGIYANTTFSARVAVA